MRNLRTVRRALLGLTTAALLTGGTLVAPAHAATPEAESAADWLVSELQDGLLPGGFSHGVTLDTFFGLAELNTHPAARSAIIDAMESQIGAYTTYDGVVYAASTAKLLAAIETAGVAPASYGDVNLRRTLAERVRRSGAQKGRAKDMKNEWSDSSNTVGQSFAVRAFALSDHRLKGMTTSFLLKQQCDAGFFRLYMESRDFTCQSGRTAGLSAPDVDATAYAVMALRTAKRAGVSGLGDDIRDALAWLVRTQGADGSFGGADTSSATSTGLAARVLDGTRFDDAASAAAQWVSQLQITTENSAGTARSGDIGAVADDTQKFEAAASGISESARTSWYISTAQGGPGLNALVAP